MVAHVAMPARIGARYRVTHKLGKGGMATVYAVHDEQQGRQVALKQLSAEVLSRVPRSGLLFEREFHTLTQLRHPHIVEAYDYGVDEAGPYYTMELLEGSDLRGLAPCDHSVACRILRQAATALSLLHSRRLIHRDLSPRNLWRTPDGTVKLIDFGAMGTQGALSLQLIGTPPFTAPEVYHRQTIDARTDLYALGTIGYWLLTGRQAYPAARFRDLPDVWKQAPAPPASPHGDLPDGLVGLLRSLMSLELIARPRCAAEVIERLDALLEEPAPTTPGVAEGYLITPSLVGRSAEVAALRDQIRALRSGGGSVVMIEAQPGHGRSRMLHEVSLIARLSGATAVDAACKQHAHRPYGVALALAAALMKTDPEPELEDDGASTAVRARPELTSMEDVDDPREHRSRLLGATVDALAEAAAHGPLVITIDDAELADEASLSVLAALAATARQSRLLLALGTTPDAAAGGPLAGLRAGATVIPLPALPEPAVRELVGSIFGDVPHVGRLAVWVQQWTEGNVLMIVELLHELVARGDVRYEEGAWVIPREVQSLSGGARLQDALGQRVDGLGADARELAELWAICSGELPLERARAAFEGADPDGRTAARFFSALDELLYGEVLAGADGHYGFRRESLRTRVLEELDADRRELLHQRIGDAMLAEPELEPQEQVEAAWHLMRGRAQRERGARLVTQALATPQLLAVVAEGAVPALVEALDILEHSGTAEERARLAVALMRCAYYYDTRLAEPAMPMLEELAEATGIPRDGSVEPTAALAAATRRWDLRDPASRGLHPGLALIELNQLAIAALGVFILRFDLPAIARLSALLSPLSQLERHNPLSVGQELVDLVLQAMRGHEAASSRRRLAFLERLADPGALVGVPELSRKHLTATQLHAQGMVEAPRDPTRALARADAIEAVGLKMYGGAALQIRFMVALYRGDAAGAARYRERLDLVSMQEGSGRQTEMWLVRYLVLPYFAWGDVLALRQTVQQLEELKAEHPGYDPFHAIALGALQHERGQHAEAIETLERALELAPAGEHAAWLQAMLVYVPALVLGGQPRRALEVAATVFTAPPPGVDVERLRGLLSPPLAFARALDGDLEGGKAELEALVARSSEDGETDLALARLYEYQARAAQLDADGTRFETSIRRMGEHARSCGNPSLISRHEVLASAFETGDGDAGGGAQETLAATRIDGKSTA